MLASTSAISGAIVGALLVGSGYASVNLIIAALAAVWIWLIGAMALMGEGPPLFGSYGLPPRGSADEASSERAQPVFGRRTNSPRQSVSLRLARLAYLRSVLHTLFEDEDAPDNTPSFKLTNVDEPRLLIGETAVVQIDYDTGLIVFREAKSCSGVIVVSASTERIVDHVICHLAAGSTATGPEKVNQAARRLVGQTLADVERRLILQTLRHCHGNCMRTADMLGISLRTIRNKLREYWRTSEADGGQP